MKTFQIVPKATKITKITAAAKGFTVTWKKQPKSTTGYQIQYSTGKKFAKKTTKTKTVKKASAAKLTVKKLKAKKKVLCQSQNIQGSERKEVLFKLVKVQEHKDRQISRELY